MSDPDLRRAEEEKAALFKEVRQALMRAKEDLESKKPDTDTLLQQAQAKQDNLLDLLNNQLRRFETEKAKLSRKIEELAAKVEESLNLKSEAEARTRSTLDDLSAAEKEIEELTLIKTDLGKRTEALLSEKQELAADLETLVNNKRVAEEKAASAMDEIGEMEKTLLGTVEDLEKKNQEIAKLKAALEKAVLVAEAAESERNQTQEKLNKFQENWERMIASQ